MDNNIIDKYINEKSCKIILKKLTSDNLIGKGTWGSVYKFEIKNIRISVKIQPLYNDKTYTDIIDNRNIDLEASILKELSDFKIKNNFYHFPYFYKSINCKLQNLLFYEYSDNTIEKFFSKKFSFDMFKNIVYQIIIAIYFFQKVTGYYHNDINTKNILIKNSDLKVLDYRSVNLEKSLPCNGFYIIIWDYASAKKIINENDPNLDILQLKKMFINFIKFYIDIIFDYDTLYDLCMENNKKKFKKYFVKEELKNSLKWSKVQNDKNRFRKIHNSVKKSIIFYIIENKLLNELASQTTNTKIYLPDYEMLDFVNNLPNNINECFQLF